MSEQEQYGHVINMLNLLYIKLSMIGDLLLTLIVIVVIGLISLIVIGAKNNAK